MKLIPRDVYVNVFIPFTGDIDLARFSLTNRTAQTETDKERSIRREITLNYPKQLIAFTSIHGIAKINVLDLNGRVGNTDYIDFIKQTDFMSKTDCILRGKDKFSRSFIAIRHELGVVTFFQRYTDSKNYWTHGGNLPNGIYGSGGIDFNVGHSILGDDRVSYMINQVHQTKVS